MYLFPLYFVFVSLLHFQHLDIFYHQLPCICHQSIFVVVPSQSCARRRSSMHRTAFDLETARKVHLHHFLSRHHNLFFSNSDLLPHTLNCFWQLPPSSTLLESGVFSSSHLASNSDVWSSSVVIYDPTGWVKGSPISLFSGCAHISSCWQ